jgi:acyl-CoA thioester hydrolase
MSAYHYASKIEVQFRDCDPLGHVNNAVYVTYFEIARFAYCRDALGFTIEDAVGSESFIMARVECNFRSQARLGDRLDVRIRVSEIGRSSFQFEYEIVQAADGRVVADGKSVQVSFDYQAQRSIPVPESFRAKVERFEERTFARPTPAPATPVAPTA